MDTQRLRAESLLLLASLIWGFAFVAQRAGMEHLGPFTFNAVRFALGAVAVLPLAVLRRRRRPPAERSSPRDWIPAVLIVGSALFAGASLQQAGLVYTTAGKAGFITGLYVVLVPLFGWLAGRRTSVAGALAAGLAVLGLYLLSVRQGLRLAPGDLLVLGGAFCWTAHVLAVSRFAPRVRAFELAAGQFLITAVASALLAVVLEEPSWTAMRAAAVPLLYAGLLSAGVAFTLQVLGQRSTPPAAAAILLSLEAVFAAVGGWWLLGERLDGRGIAGCILMLAAMLVAQWPGKRLPPAAHHA